MLKIILLFIASLAAYGAYAQNPVGKWKKISHVSSYNGQSFDSHLALLQQRPCAANIVWEINADNTFRLNAANSGCDQRYKEIQEKLWSKTKWKMEGNLFTTSATNFAVGQTYTIVFSGNKLVLTGTEGQGVITYQRIP
ncbi:hypothetical protein [Foetidibacter luteolus]|uniref:hypothetical protein n=1 Tax=Foetidibacter luteolus TaxID=2608880 RepID=UPI00129BB8FC|nr:hypothetical protein [Foetidibacter luteolus]